MENSAGSINPVALLALVVACCVTLFSSRQNAVKALLFTSAVIPLAQMFIIGGIHVHFFRIVILAGIIRIFARGETKGFKWHVVDKLTIWWALAAIVCACIRGLDAETVGWAFAAWGSYFFVRCTFREPDDLLAHLRFLAILMLGIALSMTVESVTKHNPFAVFGGVNVSPVLREGRVRCQGPFRIFLLAGSFSATLFPLMVGLWLQGPPHRTRAILGIVGCILGTYLCNSSGPLMCFMAAIGGFMLWRLRFRMYLFRRTCVVLLIMLSLYMKGPVYYIISKVGDIFGGSSWHRSYLIDQFFSHLMQWLLYGTNYTANWAPAGEVLSVDPNNMDITNNYIMQGLRGGVWQFALFIAIIVCCFKIVGRLIRGSSDGVMVPMMLWSLGVTVAGHCVAFIDISYFDQTAVFWYWLIAIVVCFSQYITSPQTNDGGPDQGHLEAEVTQTASPPGAPLPCA